MALEWLFGNDEKNMTVTSSVKTDPTSDADRMRRAEDKYAHIEKLASDRQAELLAKKDEEFALMVKLHNEDVAGYKFKCERWGNFLSLSIARLANPIPHDDYDKERFWPQHYSGALNLDLIRRIEFREGRPPDTARTIYYSFYKDPHGEIILYGSDSPANKGGPIIRAISPDHPAGANFSRGLLIGEKPYAIKIKTPDMPRPALDDEIRLIGIDTMLHAPAGMGAEIYKQLLLATGKDAAE